MNPRCLPFVLLWALYTTTLFAGEADKRLDIYWVDVEGGAATLIVTPAGESILIDTGNPGLRDPGRIVKVATAVAKIRRIDHLIITHYHRDHYGGAETLATMLPIGTVYDNGMFDQMPDNPGKAYFEFACETRKVIQPGDTLTLKQAEGAAAVKFQCLGRRQSFVDSSVANETNCAAHRPKERDGSDNANSVVMLLEFGPFRFFDGGDLTWNQEMNLVCPNNPIGEVDVYQVTHHGLDSSNNPVIVRSLQPRVAIMNNGTRKGCAPAVFETLTATKSIEAIYQVHKNLRPDGAVNNAPEDFIANRGDSKSCRGNFIQLSVTPNGKKYSVHIPAHGHKQEYVTKNEAAAS